MYLDHTHPDSLATSESTHNLPSPHTHIHLDWPASKPQESPTSRVLGLQVCTATPGFYMGSGDKSQSLVLAKHAPS